MGPSLPKVSRNVSVSKPIDCDILEIERETYVGKSLTLTRGKPLEDGRCLRGALRWRESELYIGIPPAFRVVCALEFELVGI